MGFNSAFKGLKVFPEWQVKNRNVAHCYAWFIVTHLVRMFTVGKQLCSALPHIQKHVSLQYYSRSALHFFGLMMFLVTCCHL